MAACSQTTGRGMDLERTMVRQIICFSAVIVCLLSPAYALDITIVTENAPPYNYEEDGKVKGVSTEVLQAIFQKIDIDEPPIQVYPWARAYRMALNGENVLIYSITRLPEREEQFKWVGTIAPVTVYLYKFKERTDIQLMTLDDAKQYVVGAARDDTKLQYLEGKGFDISEVVSSDEQNLRKLKAKRIELAPFEELKLAHVVKTMRGIDLSDFEKAYPLQDLFLDVSIAFSFNTPDEVVDRFKKALEKIKTDGTHKMILKKYFQ